LDDEAGQVDRHPIVRLKHESSPGRPRSIA
jgi:hypothetical protein